MALPQTAPNTPAAGGRRWPELRYRAYLSEQARRLSREPRGIPAASAVARQRQRQRQGDAGTSES
jgi:hypothetical protein